MDNLTQMAYNVFKKNIYSPNGLLIPEYRNCSNATSSGTCNNGFFSLDTLTMILFYAINDTQFRNSWTCRDIESYCYDEATYFDSLRRMLEINNIGKLFRSTSKYVSSLSLEGDILAPIGLVSNINLFLNALSMRKQGDVFWFLTFISLAQIGQALNRIGQNSYMIYLLIPDAYFIRAFLVTLTVDECFNSAKSFSISMAFFMSFYRYMAVCTPIWFSQMKFKKYFIGALVWSVFVGCLPMIGVQSIARSKSGTWMLASQRDPSFAFATNYIYPFIFCFGIATSIMAMVFSALTLRSLRVRKAKIAKMMSPASALEEHKRMVSMCRIQAIETAGLIIDVGFQLSDRLHTTVHTWSSCQTTDCLNQAFINRRRILFYCALMSKAVFNLFRGLCHGELLFFYLIFSKQFRTGYKNLYPSIFRWLKSSYLKLKSKRCCCSIGASSTEVIELRTVTSAIVRVRRRQD